VGLKENLIELRKHLDISQEELGKNIGLTRFSVSNFEAGKRNITERVIQDICREFKVNEDWLRSGHGEMFRTKSETEEVAEYVSELLDDDGSNPVYALIKDMMKTYVQLDQKSQEVINDTCRKFIENMSKKIEG
jgi:transcriptional regulator with XRE-family HTH domain